MEEEFTPIGKKKLSGHKRSILLYQTLKFLKFQQFYLKVYLHSVQTVFNFQGWCFFHGYMNANYDIKTPG